MYKESEVEINRLGDSSQFEYDCKIRGSGEEESRKLQQI